jgi:predicted CXXCH cytochrome family protein
MHRLTLRNAREKSPWLALGVSLFIAASTIAMTLLWPAESRAFANAGETDRSSRAGGYQSPQQCRECHAAEFQSWSGTSHADASFDPIFQVYLQRAAQPGECFTCHTTGYNQVTGQFVLAGVTCEACHGPYREGHTAESMMIASPEELCGACHASTLAEWASSRHGKAGVTCTACHEVHTQKTRSAANTNALCTGCHHDQTRDATHTIHIDAGVHCVDCHLARPSDDVSSALNGKAATGHFFAVLVSTCSNCHPVPLRPDVAHP